MLYCIMLTLDESLEFESPRALCLDSAPIGVETSCDIHTSLTHTSWRVNGRCQVQKEVWAVFHGAATPQISRISLLTTRVLDLGSIYR